MGCDPRDRRLLTISPYLTFRPETGGTQRIHYLNRYIAESGWNVTQFSIGPLWPEASHAWTAFRHSESYCEIRYSNPAVPLANRILKQFGGAQIAPSLLPSYILRSPTLDRLVQEHPIVMLEHPHAYGLVRHRLPPGSRLVLDAHNIESDLYTALANPIAGWANRTLFALERELMERADLVLFCSREDHERAIGKFGLSGERFRTAPNGADIASVQVPDMAERLAAKRSLGLDNRPTALFAGSCWQPNIEAAQKIVLLAHQMPEVTFLVIGRVGEALHGLPENVQAPGFVPALRRYAAAADLALNPMFSGSGSNIKVFDYLAHGLPVVSTPFGARGLQVTGDDALVTCPFEDFPMSIRHLLADGMAARRQQAARKMAKQYDWRTIAGGIVGELDALE